MLASPIDGNETNVVDLTSVRTKSKGDVILVFGNPPVARERRFLVSTQVLSLASRDFAALFFGHMREGKALESAKETPIYLREDDADAMEIILRTLHHAGGKVTGMNLDLLAKIAIQSDKYLCREILEPWVEKWLLDVPSDDSSPIDLGLKLLIAYKLRSPTAFYKTSKLAIRRLKPDLKAAWSQNKSIGLLPGRLEAHVTGRIRDIASLAQREIEDVELPVLKSTSWFTMDGVECTICGHVENVQDCHGRCDHGRMALRQRYCNAAVRTSEYLDSMTSAMLWGHDTELETLSLEEIISRLEMASATMTHSCAGGSRCPLLAQVERLVSNTKSLADTLDGLTWEDVVRGNGDSGHSHGSWRA